MSNTKDKNTKQKTHSAIKSHSGLSNVNAVVASIQGMTGVLKNQLNHLNLQLTDVQIQQLLDYLSLMAKWNSVYNLTAIRDAQGMFVQHLIDSLAVVKFFIDRSNQLKRPIAILDVGAGGGLPGIPLAICCPLYRVHLVDAVEKKTSFLMQVKAQLRLENIQVFHARVESLEGKYDVITSRAFAEIKDFVACSAHLLSDDGLFFALKGIYPTEELDRFLSENRNNWQTDVSTLSVPLLNAERHLVFIKRH